MLFHPLTFGPTSRDAVIAGAVLSMFIPLTVTLAVLPALSSAVPVTLWFAPSPVRVTGDVQLAIPESSSAQVNVTVTSVLFHPLPLAPGETLPVIVGGVLSGASIASKWSRATELI